jgi:hypothetical protein
MINVKWLPNVPNPYIEIRFICYWEAVCFFVNRDPMNDNAKRRHLLTSCWLWRLLSSETSTIQPRSTSCYEQETKSALNTPKECYILGCDAMLPVRISPTFRKNVLLQSSGPNSVTSKQLAESKPRRHTPNIISFIVTAVRASIWIYTERLRGKESHLFLLGETTRPRIRDRFGSGADVIS